MSIQTDKNEWTVEVVGQEPEHQPYIAISDSAGRYVDSISRAEALRLAKQIAGACGHTITKAKATT